MVVAKCAHQARRLLIRELVLTLLFHVDQDKEESVTPYVLTAHSTLISQLIRDNALHAQLTKLLQLSVSAHHAQQVGRLLIRELVLL